MAFGEYNHYRHGHHPATWGEASGGFPSQARAALPEAVAVVEAHVHQGLLLTPLEAMALACGEAREKETLYSIALRISQEKDVALESLLKPLCNRFPGYA